jgi:hypothetical protein
MSIPPESVEIGQCYLTVSGTVRRVTALPHGRVQFRQRAGRRPTWANYKTEILELRSFAFSVERAVPCDWTLENDEGPPSQSRG